MVRKVITKVTEVPRVPQVGYVYCACRDCFEIAIGREGRALCHSCQKAGCEAGADQECQSPYAYGMDDSDE